jgi:hypothetical protein
MLVALHLTLLYFMPQLWLSYVIVIYLGYVGIAAINFVQHPPVQYGTGFTTSFPSPTYNAIFFNNGLHFEHHDRIQEPVIELTPSAGLKRRYAARLDPSTKPVEWVRLKLT